MTEKHRQVHELTPDMEIRRTTNALIHYITGGEFL